mmetsp:Transcript_10179/g.21599  ORF Transcript_10179/g.21599 Transcript_10179/m.21599 type:complete len:381 (+) Transcript_10179:37-1179(+)
MELLRSSGALHPTTPLLWFGRGTLKMACVARWPHNERSSDLSVGEYVVLDSPTADAPQVPPTNVDLVMTAAFMHPIPAPGFGFDHFAVFGGSLLRTGYKGDAVVAVWDDEDIRLQMWQNDFGFRVGKLEDFLSSARQVGLANITEDGRVEGSIYVLRYFFFLHYLETYWERYKDGHVLLSDFKDVFFQRNPFDVPSTMSSETLNVFLERDDFDPNSPVGINRMWVSACFGDDVTESLASSGVKISCSGVTMGPARAVRGYLQQMTEKFLEIHLRGQRPCLSLIGVDQGVHNVLLHRGMLGPNVTVWADGDGAVFTVRKHFGVMRSALGLFYHPDNDADFIPAIVHQYDRIPAMKELVWQLYPFIDQKQQFTVIKLDAAEA